MIKKLTSIIVFILPMYIYGQMVYNFDVEPDTSFWDFEISEAADSTLMTRRSSRHAILSASLVS